MSKIKIIILVIIIILLAAIGLSLKKDSPKIDGEISSETQESFLENSLIIAINDEYKARATYKKQLKNLDQLNLFQTL